MSKRYFHPDSLWKVYLWDVDSKRVIGLLQESSLPFVLSPLHRLEMERVLRAEPEARGHWREDLAAGLYEFADFSLSSLVSRAAELAANGSDEVRALDYLHVAAALALECTEWVSFASSSRLAARCAGLRILPESVAGFV